MTKIQPQPNFWAFTFASAKEAIRLYFRPIRFHVSILRLLSDHVPGFVGRLFRKVTNTIDYFVTNPQVRPAALAYEAVELASWVIHGQASKELAAAVKEFAEAEDKKIDTELKRRSLEVEIRKKEAEAKTAQIEALNAELELIKKLKDLGVVIHIGVEGNLRVLPADAVKNIETAALEAHHKALEKIIAAKTPAELLEIAFKNPNQA